jgi:hypothetical protein
MNVNDKFVGVRIRVLGTSVCVATHPDAELARGDHPAVHDERAGRTFVITVDHLRQLAYTPIV